MVGIVIVSHSAQLAEGTVELAREMAGPDVSIVAAGGLDLPGRPLGTDAALVARAVDQAWSDDGVLVLMDLGSAVLSAEMALELIPAERRSEVLLCEAPVVEGAVAAAVAARLGEPLAQVADEARGGLAGKIAHLGASPGQPTEPERAEAAGGALAPEADGALEIRISVPNRLGLHARPAARFVQTVGQFDATVTAENLTVPAGPASARSLNGVATLGVRQGHEILCGRLARRRRRCSAPCATSPPATSTSPRPTGRRGSRQRLQGRGPPGPSPASRPAAPPPSAPCCGGSPPPPASRQAAQGTFGRRGSRCHASPRPTPVPSRPGWLPPWRRPGGRCWPQGTRWPPAPAGHTNRPYSTRTCCSSRMRR